MTVELELGHDELEATTRSEIESEMSDEVLETFETLRLAKPDPVRVLPLHHQISQKLHACTEPGSARAHDLVDLQLMAEHAEPSLVRDTAVRLFRFRKAHPWPPTVVAGLAWEARYLESAEGLDVLAFSEAVTWANEYIARVDASEGAGLS